jgi:hypothetical protein
MSCYEIYLFNVILRAIVIIRTNYSAIRKLLMQVKSRITFEIWKREER